jgi:hypothetical protein
MRAKVEFRERHKNTICRIAPVDGLTLFGLFGVSAMLVFYALEDRSHWFVRPLVAIRHVQRMYASRAPFGSTATRLEQRGVTGKPAELRMRSSTW